MKPATNNGIIPGQRVLFPGGLVGLVHSVRFDIARVHWLCPDGTPDGLFGYCAVKRLSLADPSVVPMFLPRIAIKQLKWAHKLQKRKEAGG